VVLSAIGLCPMAEDRRSSDFREAKIQALDPRLRGDDKFCQPL
jgi:hypothetical protein